MANWADLWTYQSPDFSLIRGEVNQLKSQYQESIPKYLESIATLAKLLKTNQFVWCHAHPDHKWYKTSSLEIRYSLRVPVTKILASMDTWAWETILEQQTVPAALKSKYLKPWDVLFKNDLVDLNTTVLLPHPLAPEWIKSQEPWQL